MAWMAYDNKNLNSDRRMPERPTNVGKFSVFEDKEVMLFAQRRQSVNQRKVKVFDDVNVGLILPNAYKQDIKVTVQMCVP